MQEFNPQKAAFDVAVNMDINSEMMRQSGLLAHYASLAAERERRLASLEHTEEVTGAVVEHEIRQAAIEAGQKLTVDQIKSAVLRDLRMAKKRNAVNDMRLELQLIKGVVEALRHKKDMLIQLSNNGRQEFAGELRTGNGAVGDRRERASSFLEASRRATEAAGGPNHA